MPFTTLIPNGKSRLKPPPTVGTWHDVMVGGVVAEMAHSATVLVFAFGM